MNSPRELDDKLLFTINSLSRHTGWLHGVVENYAKYGVVLFGLLLAAGLLHARTRDSRTLGAAGWSGMATLIALGLNQPVSRRLGRAAAIAAVVMAFTRVYVAAHYPRDVAADLLFGATVAVVGWLILGRVLLTVTAWLRRNPGRHAVFAPVEAPVAVRTKVESLA